MEGRRTLQGLGRELEGGGKDTGRLGEHELEKEHGSGEARLGHRERWSGEKTEH